MLRLPPWGCFSWGCASTPCVAAEYSKNGTSCAFNSRTSVAEICWDTSSCAIAGVGCGEWWFWLYGNCTIRPLAFPVHGARIAPIATK